MWSLTHYQMTILDWSKLKQSADINFKFDENSRKFSKRVENTVGKGEIARYEQFLLFPQCFQKAGVIVWEWVNVLSTIIQLNRGTVLLSKSSWEYFYSLSVCMSLLIIRTRLFK